MTAGRKNRDTKQDWSTPENYVRSIRAVFGGRIDLDPCSNSFSVVRAGVEYCFPDQDGLKASWDFPTIYVNPPYGADRERRTTIRHWLAACAAAHRRHGSEVLALVPVATNTRHWKEHVFGAATGVAFLYDTRLKFLVNGVPSLKGAPMSCAMVYWGEHFERFREVFSKHGAVVDLRPLHALRSELSQHVTRRDRKVGKHR
jgi:hypothetical protein